MEIKRAIDLDKVTTFRIFVLFLILTLFLLSDIFLYKKTVSQDIDYKKVNVIVTEVYGGGKEDKVYTYYNNRRVKIQNAPNGLSKGVQIEAYDKYNGELYGSIFSLKKNTAIGYTYLASVAITVALTCWFFPNLLAYIAQKNKKNDNRTQKN